MAFDPAPHHDGPIPLEGWDTSVLYSSKETPKTLIVLVHGFWSQSAKTWPKLNSHLLVSPSYKNADILFWDYDSRTGDIPLEVGVLRDALQVVWARGRACVQPIQGKFPRPQPVDYNPNYKRLVLVGYSLGGVLSRGAVLDGHRSAASWFSALKLVLFAPAHLGAKASHLLAYKENDPFEGFKKIARRFAEPLNVLVAGSPYLAGLREETESAAAGAPGLRPVETLFGEHDDWVEIGGYTGDPPYTTAAGRKHENVQKADDIYHDAIECIRRAI